MNQESAKLGFLLDQLRNRAGSEGEHRTFFVNSSLEALSGALKLARQTSVRNQRADEGWILVLDEENDFSRYFDPTQRGLEFGATPHLQFVTNPTLAANALEQRAWSGVVLVRRANTPTSVLKSLSARAKQRGATVIACHSELELDHPDLFGNREIPADVVVFGENLTGRQVPFGCFTMTKQAHKVWDNDTDCFAQTSTFGGNAAVAAVALTALGAAGHIDETHREVFRDIDRNFLRMVEYWGQTVNPGMARMAPIFGMDMHVLEVRGGRLLVDEQGGAREIVDCSGGFGCNLRGHNPPGIPELLDNHDPAHDYFTELEAELASLTKYTHALPAVSGATAVDMAAQLGLVAQPTRRKLVTFVGNFSGKTLFAVNLSKHGPQLTESDDDAFRPYYTDLVYIDPFAQDASARLETLLRSGEVALVWFELLRGGMCEALPSEIRRIVTELKDVGGYFIGIDEVLSGGWRTGQNYLAQMDDPELAAVADITTVGKHLSDMTVPMAAVLVTEEVFAKANTYNSDYLQHMRSHYRFNLGAHVAVHALRRAREPAQREVSLRAQALIESGLRRIVHRSKLFSEVRGKGAMLLPVMNPRYFPFHHRSKLGNMLEMALSHLIYQRAGVFVFLLRFLHRTCTSIADAEELIQRLEQGLSGVTPTMVYRYAASRIVSPAFPGVAHIVARGIVPELKS